MVEFLKDFIAALCLFAILYGLLIIGYGVTP